MNDRGRVIQYLKSKLVDPERGEGAFREFGPSSLICETQADRILVYVNQCNLVIIHDGENVADGMEMIQLLQGAEFMEEDALNQYYLQPILHRL